MRFYDRPTEKQAVYDRDGQIKKYVVTRHEPVVECPRSRRHWAEFDITDARRSLAA
jgi:hypothetical protein